MHEYEREEREQIDLFLKKVSEGKFEKTEIFPSPNRFKKLNYPISYIGELGVAIWPVVAFSGSAIIPLMPIEKQQFEAFHRFKITDIKQMVSFCEETGKIQFVLMRKPTDYYKLDFLEPIFKRLRPPQFVGFQANHFGKSEDLDKYYKEFTLVANSGLRGYEKTKQRFSGNKLAFHSYMTNLCGNYMTIRAIADPEFSEYFVQIFKSDYKIGVKLLDLINILALRPIRNPLRATEAYTLETIASIHRIEPGKEKHAFPCEFGRLLMKKMTYYPETLEACKYITARYEDEKVIKLFQAVKEGVLKNDPSIVEKSEEALSAALDSIWNNRSIQNKINGIKYGVPLALGAMGAIAGSLTGDYRGLLASLGFETVDRLFGIKGDDISERIGKALAPSYQTIIFDFKQKYALE